MPEKAQNENQVTHLMENTLHVFIGGKQTTMGYLTTGILLSEWRGSSKLLMTEE